MASQKSRKIPPNPLAPIGPSTKAEMDSFWPTPLSSESPVFLVFHIVISWVPVNQTAAPFPLRWIQLLLLVPKTSSQPKKNVTGVNTTLVQQPLNINDVGFNNYRLAAVIYSGLGLVKAAETRLTKVSWKNWEISSSIAESPAIFMPDSGCKGSSFLKARTNICTESNLCRMVVLFWRWCNVLVLQSVVKLNWLLQTSGLFMFSGNGVFVLEGGAAPSVSSSSLCSSAGLGRVSTGGRVGSWWQRHFLASPRLPSFRYIRNCSA